MSIYRGFAGQITDLKLLSCAYHPQKNIVQKILEPVRQQGALTKIICDIYGRNCEGGKELGLNDSTNIDDFRISVGSIKVFGIIYAQAFMNGSLKSELLF